MRLCNVAYGNSVKLDCGAEGNNVMQNQALFVAGSVNALILPSFPNLLSKDQYTDFPNIT